MNPFNDSVAFGAPGIEPRWSSSAKEGVGTAYHTSCRLWFTLSHGIPIANGGGVHPARNVVGGDFLHFVRFGIRSADDPIVRDSIDVIDQVIKHDLPQGPGWRRYNHDGYGQKDDGSAYDGTGVGRCWPILTGERGHYELAAGRDA